MRNAMKDFDSLGSKDYPNVESMQTHDMIVINLIT